MLKTLAVSINECPLLILYLCLLKISYKIFYNRFRVIRDIVPWNIRVSAFKEHAGVSGCAAG